MSRIDYDLKRIRGFAFDVDGVLSPSTVPMDADGLPMRMVNVKDGYALQLAVKHGYKIAIISGGSSEAVERRFHILGIDRVYTGVANKLPVLNNWMSGEGLDADEVVYAGDDIPDMECMAAAGLSVAPRDAAPELRQMARYIAPIDGGYGVARDIIEQVMKARGEWLSTDAAYRW